METANRAWEQYHQNQLQIFRDLLEHWISFDEQSNLQAMAQQISLQLERLTENQDQGTNEGVQKVFHRRSVLDSMREQLEHYQSKVSTYEENLQALNETLTDVYRTCDDLRERNDKLRNDSDRQAEEMTYLQQTNEALLQENQHLQHKIEEASRTPVIQRVESPREVIPSSIS